MPGKRKRRRRALERARNVGRAVVAWLRDSAGRARSEPWFGAAAAKEWADTTSILGGPQFYVRNGVLWGYRPHPRKWQARMARG